MYISMLCDLCCRWEEFTDAVIRVLSSKKDIVYLLWGNPAQLK
jgi:uracil DNA glycosylase